VTPFTGPQFRPYRHYETWTFHVVGLDKKRTPNQTRPELFAEDFRSSGRIPDPRGSPKAGPPARSICSKCGGSLCKPSSSGKSLVLSNATLKPVSITASDKGTGRIIFSGVHPRDPDPGCGFRSGALRELRDWGLDTSYILSARSDSRSRTLLSKVMHISQSISRQ
jgi:hypothetical protein